MDQSNIHQNSQALGQVQVQGEQGSDNITIDEIDHVVPDQDEQGDIPMDDDDEGEDDDGMNEQDSDQELEMDDQAEGGGAGMDQEQQEEFKDTSIAAFYSHRKSLFCIKLHPSYPKPPLALSGGEDDGGWIWDTREGREVKRLDGHKDSVTSVSWNNQGDLAATGGMDGKVKIWKCKDGASFEDWENLIDLEGPDEVVWLNWHPKGNVLTAGASDSTVWMWQLPTGKVMNVFSGHTGAVTCGAFTPDGKKLVTADDDGSLVIWDPRSPSPLGKLQRGDSRFHFDLGITSLTISPDSKVVVVGGGSGEIKVVNIGGLDLGTPASVVGVLPGHQAEESVEKLEFIDLVGTGKFSHLISASTEGKATVWDVALSKMRCEVVHEAAITNFVVHSGTTLFSTSSADHTIKTWDARTGACLATQTGFTDGVLALDVGKDDGFTQGSDTGGIGAFTRLEDYRGWKVVGAGDEGVALVFRV
ncbi:WD40 repeat-like protein [Violaceomyces palustris]|uniref:WD40 repeat-like protein n=1 Tax=Violaceomyces palustris TaxID=1673888 RepID=A0ACD0P190_9BASI|nr:WD40 repeat-like protein [Violaceomyces palustris]